MNFVILTVVLSWAIVWQQHSQPWVSGGPVKLQMVTKGLNACSAEQNAAKETSQAAVADQTNGKGQAAHRNRPDDAILADVTCYVAELQDSQVCVTLVPLPDGMPKPVKFDIVPVPTPDHMLMILQRTHARQLNSAASRSKSKDSFTTEMSVMPFQVSLSCGGSE